MSDNRNALEQHQKDRERFQKYLDNPELLRQTYFAGCDPITPGSKSHSFEICLNEKYFQPHDLLTGPDGAIMEVTKVHKLTIWQRIISFFGFNVNYRIDIKNLSK
jgi:hypothetical protein